MSGLLHYEVGIVGHVDRAADHDELAELSGARLVSVDDGTAGCNSNHVATWMRLLAESPESDWLVVLEDDAVPVPGFKRQLALALSAAPTQVVSLYLGTGHPSVWQPKIKKAVEVADAWIVSEHLLHAVGYAMHAELVTEMLDYLDHDGMRGVAIDSRITNWLRANRILVGYVNPSLVDHLDEESVIGVHPDGMPRNRPRHAWVTGTRDNWRSRSTLL